MCGRIMSRAITMAACYLLFISSVTAQQKKWDGGGGDSLFTTAANWTDDIVPLSTDSILLDNSIVASSYLVQLPPAAVGISFASMRIQPLTSRSIIFLIPKQNTSIPAVITSGGIYLEEGALLQNSSGAASGNAISIADSLYIFNGASYIHNTDIGHASLITRLATAPGAERGTVEFNVPGTASYTLSVSNRIYGNLILNAQAAGGTRTYISTGVNPMLVRGDFIIHTGATYSLNFSGDFSVMKNLQVNGVFNISTGSNSNMIRVKGSCSIDGSITETGTGLPILQMDGFNTQTLSVKGAINNSVSLRINNPSGIVLNSPVSIPYKMELLAGKLTTTDTSLLTISSAGSIVADSSLSTVFVNGPLRKLGLIAGSSFLFPVGAGNQQRWLRLQEAVGDYTVSFFRESASIISNQLDTSLHHVSNLEYWKVQTESNQQAKIELSFNDVNSGGVTDLFSLRVAQFTGAIWKSAGATAFTGSAGASGSVVSDTVQFLQAATYFYSLGSANANQNPLPLRTASLLAVKENDGLLFKWTIHPIAECQLIELQESNDGIQFHSITQLNKMVSSYKWATASFNGTRYYRIKIIWVDGTQYFSAVRAVFNQNSGLQLRYLYPVLAHQFLQITLVSDKAQKLEIRVMDLRGNIIRKHLYFIEVGEQKITVPVAGLRAGQYQIFGLSSGLYTKPLRFIKS